MKGYAVLSSGGKDSILALQEALDSSLFVSHMVTVRPSNPDSLMFHTANLDAVPVIARLTGLRFHAITSKGEEEGEVRDLAEGLASLPCEGIVTGAIASQYQMKRIRAVADALSLEVFSPLWHRSHADILDRVSSRLNAIIVVCAADGLGAEFLGRRIDSGTARTLLSLERTHRINPCGEGGEFETLTISAPCYQRPLTCTGQAVKSSPDGRHELILTGFA